MKFLCKRSHHNPQFLFRGKDVPDYQQPAEDKIQELKEAKKAFENQTSDEATQALRNQQGKTYYIYNDGGTEPIYDGKGAKIDQMGEGLEVQIVGFQKYTPHDYRIKIEDGNYLIRVQYVKHKNGKAFKKAAGYINPKHLYPIDFKKAVEEAETAKETTPEETKEIQGYTTVEGESVNGFIRGEYVEPVYGGLPYYNSLPDLIAGNKNPYSQIAEGPLRIKNIWQKDGWRERLELEHPTNKGQSIFVYSTYKSGGFTVKKTDAPSAPTLPVHDIPDFSLAPQLTEIEPVTLPNTIPATVAVPDIVPPVPEPIRGKKVSVQERREKNKQIEALLESLSALVEEVTESRRRVRGIPHFSDEIESERSNHTRLSQKATKLSQSLPGGKGTENLKSLNDGLAELNKEITQKEEAIKKGKEIKMAVAKELEAEKNKAVEALQEIQKKLNQANTTEAKDTETKKGLLTEIEKAKSEISGLTVAKASKQEEDPFDQADTLVEKAEKFLEEISKSKPKPKSDFTYDQLRPAGVDTSYANPEDFVQIDQTGITPDKFDLDLDGDGKPDSLAWLIDVTKGDAEKVKNELTTSVEKIEKALEAENPSLGALKRKLDALALKIEGVKNANPGLDLSEIESRHTATTEKVNQAYEEQVTQIDALVDELDAKCFKLSELKTEAKQRLERGNRFLKIKIWVLSIKTEIIQYIHDQTGDNEIPEAMKPYCNIEAIETEKEKLERGRTQIDSILEGISSQIYQVDTLRNLGYEELLKGIEYGVIQEKILTIREEIDGFIEGKIEETDISENSKKYWNESAVRSARQEFIQSQQEFSKYPLREGFRFSPAIDQILKIYTLKLTKVKDLKDGKAILQISSSISIPDQDPPVRVFTLANKPEADIPTLQSVLQTLQTWQKEYKDDFVKKKETNMEQASKGPKDVSALLARLGFTASESGHRFGEFEFQSAEKTDTSETFTVTYPATGKFKHQITLRAEQTENTWTLHGVDQDKKSHGSLMDKDAVEKFIKSETDIIDEVRQNMLDRDEMRKGPTFMVEGDPNEEAQTLLARAEGKSLLDYVASLANAEDGGKTEGESLLRNIQRLLESETLDERISERLNRFRALLFTIIFQPKGFEPTGASIPEIKRGTTNPIEIPTVIERPEMAQTIPTTEPIDEPNDHPTSEELDPGLREVNDGKLASRADEAMGEITATLEETPPMPPDKEPNRMTLPSVTGNGETIDTTDPVASIEIENSRFQQIGALVGTSEFYDTTQLVEYFEAKMEPGDDVEEHTRLILLTMRNLKTAIKGNIEDDLPIPDFFGEAQGKIVNTEALKKAREKQEKQEEIEMRQKEQYAEYIGLNGVMVAPQLQKIVRANPTNLRFIDNQNEFTIQHVKKAGELIDEKSFPINNDHRDVEPVTQALKWLVSSNHTGSDEIYFPKSEE